MKKKVSIDEEVIPEAFFIAEMIGIIKLGYTLPTDDGKGLKTLDALKTLFLKKNVSLDYKRQVDDIFNTCKEQSLHPPLKNRKLINFDKCEEIAEEYGFIKENEPDMPDGYDDNYRHKIKEDK